MTAPFRATYTELALSPANFVMTWYSGAVTRDGKFVYGIGNSHNAYGNNGLWEYDPQTNTHKSIFPDCGSRWKWTEGVKESGHWDDPNIRALTNRNNHQAFYLPSRNEFWVLSGTTQYQSNPYFGGRFSLDTHRWEYLSKPWGEKTVNDLADFSAGLIAGHGDWVAPNAVTAVCPDIDTVVLFGGMGDATGAMVIIEPNPAGPEPYRWASAPRPPFHHPVENARHNAVAVGDTVYFVEGDRRVPGTGVVSPEVAQFWKFHVPSRTWTQLKSGPPGGYFAQLTADTAAQALLLYGGGKSNKLWVYDLTTGLWHDLTGTVPNLPRADMHTGGYIPGFGHVYKGGKRYSLTTGESEGYGASRKMMRIELTRDGAAPPPPPPPPDDEEPPVEEPPVDPPPVEEPPTEEPPPPVEEPPPSSGEPPAEEHPHTCPPAIPPTEVGAHVAAVRVQMDSIAAALGVVDGLLAQLLALTNPPPVEPPPTEEPPAEEPPVDPPPAEEPPPPVEEPPTEEPPPEPPPVEPPPTSPAALRLTWTKIPLPGWPLSPQGSMKHQRLVEGPDGRVYILGGDFGGGATNVGRQLVYSFDPLSPTGNWRMDAPECGTTANPVHWHTDEAGVAWDARRKVFWKLSGTEYGPNDPCLADGRSVKAKAITFDPSTGLWTVPPHVAQTRFGYVTNGVLDPAKDEMVQITDKAAKHLNLETGQWTSHTLPGDAIRFNAIAARVGREVYWTHRKQVLESYNLDTFKLTTHSAVPWPVPTSGWEMQMVMAYGNKLLVVRPTGRADTPRHAALYDPATRQWTTLDPGEGWGNTGMVHSSGKLILMGGGIDGPAYHNKVVWVGTLN